MQTPPPDVKEVSEPKEAPEPPKWLLTNISEATKNARKIYFIYLSFLSYCALTIVSTTDRQIILNEKVHLPILRVGVSFYGFFILAPILLIFTFLYLQFYLNKNNQFIYELKNNYGGIDSRRLYPWLLNLSEKEDVEGFMKFLQGIVVTCSLWYSMPIVLSLFSYLVFKVHNPVLTYIMGALAIIGTLLVLYFWAQYEDSSRNYNFKDMFIIPFTQRHAGKITLFSFVVLSQAFIFMLINFITVEGSFNGSAFGNVDLSYQKLVSEPKVDYKGLYWGNLKGIHLEGANLTNTILKRADLRGAHLQKARLNYVNLTGADLSDADLWRADLTGAELIGVDFTGANLTEANFTGANLSGVILEDADLSNAKLFRVDFTGANLSGADLTGADLSGVDLSDADLWGTDFTGANLWGVALWGVDLAESDFTEANLSGADLTGANLSGADLSGVYLSGIDLWSADISDADLSGADLTGANLSETDLSGVDLSGASLSGVDLSGANLSGADLSGVNLSEAETLYEAKLDPILKEKLKKGAPNLFIQQKHADKR
jgi:uncharacterized protein YjbI with pentapeptide repeats